MPDLKFKNNKFLFSILSESGKFPLLIPRIDNPDFFDKSSFKITSPPGIIQILNGDLGIGELIMNPILAPTLSSLDNNPLLAESIANTRSPYLDNLNSGAIDKITGQEAIVVAKNNMISNLIPKNSGIKALEKTIITSMMESFKPVVEFLKIFIEMLAVAEDVICMFLGTSIKILKKQIGFPSRNPRYWNENLGYAKTINFALEEFRNAVNTTIQEYDKQISDSNPLKNSVSGSFRDTDYKTDLPDNLYIGYFDENGNSVDPPRWIKDNERWLKFDVVNGSGNITTIGSPFKQLSSDYEKGVKQLRDLRLESIEKIDKESGLMIIEIEKRSQTLRNSNLSPEKLKIELETIDKEKEQAKELFGDLKQALKDVIDGTNVAGSNLVDDEDEDSGANPPAVVSEWSSKVKSAQFRGKYFPEQVSTVQSIVDFRNRPKEPYVFIPKYGVNYLGRNVEMEVPLAYSSQVKKKKVVSRGGVFFDNRVGINKTNIKIVESFDLFYNTDINKPYKDKEVTYFRNNPSDFYVPDKIKDYYLSLEWEEVLEYEVRNTRTGELLRTEKEIIPQSIDVENDYELRLIKVINAPLIGSNKTFIEGESKLDNIKLYFVDENLKSEITTDVFLNKYKALKDKVNTPNSKGVILSTGNNIPRNNLSTPDIDKNNNLKEGVIYQGLDPRYIDPNKFKVFWLVEAIKKDERGISAINGDFNQEDINFYNQNTETTPDNLSVKNGKEWYGLLDKFLAIPRILIRLVPLITTKLIPLIVKIIQLVSNPTKIKDLLLEIGITDENISKFPQSFTDYSKSGGLKDIDAVKNKPIPTSLAEAEASTIPRKDNYYAGFQFGVEDPEIISMVDGQAVVDFGLGAFGRSVIKFGLDLKAGSDTEKFEFISKKKENVDFTKTPAVRDQPIFSMILNMIKLPFEVIFKIFMYIINWVKRLLNPVKIPAAILEFLSFKWLIQIIGKDSLFEMLGMKDPLENAKTQEFINNPNLNQEELVSNLLSILSGDDADKYIEVLVFNIIKNGNVIGTETEERPYNGIVPDESNNINADINNNNNNNNPTIDNPKHGNNDFDFICGDRDFSLNDLFPLPFLSIMPKFNLCELPIVFLKPLEMILGILKMIQELLNGLISIPVSIFGLEPTLKIPKFGQEIPFADIFEKIVNRLKKELTPTFPQPNK